MRARVDRAMACDRFFAALREEGMVEVPERFSVACVAHEVPRASMADIESFIAIFDAVTGRSAWQDAVTGEACEIARQRRSEVCFFSAWDFHVPPGRPDAWQLIEFNDNGSGFVFAGLINRLFYQVYGSSGRAVLEPPPLAAFFDLVAAMIESEAEAFFGRRPEAAFLVLDDCDSLEHGRFRHELELLARILQARERPAHVASPEALRWNGGRLWCRDAEISFVINRSTDFFWDGPAFAALRAAYRDGRVCVAPNPFTYATRSDKRLLELLSCPERDAELGIRAEERELLARHVPQTRLVRRENVDLLAAERENLVFKPARGFASHGLLPSSQVGRSRLRRLLRRGEPYVAQRRVPKGEVEIDGQRLWADLRVWSHRGRRFLLSGRASRHPEILDLAPPGGWLPTYVRS
jgi:hypothetical protein